MFSERVELLIPIASDITAAAPEACVGCNTVELQSFRLARCVLDGSVTVGEAQDALRSGIGVNCPVGRVENKFTAPVCGWNNGTQ